jgi:hypothetical protein
VEGLNRRCEIQSGYKVVVTADPHGVVWKTLLPAFKKTLIKAVKRFQQGTWRGKEGGQIRTTQQCRGPLLKSASIQVVGKELGGIQQFDHPIRIPRPLKVARELFSQVGLKFMVQIDDMTVESFAGKDRFDSNKPQGGIIV